MMTAIPIKQPVFNLFFLFLCLFFVSTASNAQTKVNWMTWEQAIAKTKIQPRKIFIDIYTDWCTWCKKMDETTLKDSNVADYLNDFYYPVRLNAQQKEPIIFNGKTYEYVENGINSYHELAYSIMNGNMKYPTVVFIDETYQVIQSIPGFRTPFELELFLTYFGENNHERQPWYRFKKEQEFIKRDQMLEMPINSKRW